MKEWINRQILDKIHFQYTQENIERAIALNPPIGGYLKHSKHFSEKDLKIINTKLEDLLIK